jgi:16S rRNA (guanine966-N2)-methyltransferase
VRIIGGAWRGRTIAVPGTGTVRPTSDRVREAWFSILDLCAGSGALGIEALSRGASHVTFVDSSAPVLAAIQANLASLGAAPASYTLHRGDAVAFVRTLGAGHFTVAFADPPYALAVAAELVEAWHATPFASLLAVEHPAAIQLGDGGDRRRYGQTAITFFGA